MSNCRGICCNGPSPHADDDGEGAELVLPPRARHCTKSTTAMPASNGSIFRDLEESVISFVRFAQRSRRFSGVRVQLHAGASGQLPDRCAARGPYLEVFNTDSSMFGGSNVGNMGETIGHPESSHGRPASINITLPPLAVVVFKPMPVKEDARSLTGLRESPNVGPLPLATAR